MARAGSGRGHSRDDVARTALDILDEYGLPDLTMRRLAAALDVQPSALYWHFPNKQSLLAELSDRIVAETASVGSDLGWAARTVGEASAFRAALLAHRDGAEVVASTFALGMGSSLARDRLVAAIEAGGFDDSTAKRATTALLHFILGHVLHEQQRNQYDDMGVRGGEAATSDDETSGSDFAFGIELLVGGLRALADD